MKYKLLSYLGFDHEKHRIRFELLAGLTTFLTMSYILAVNPLILGDAGMDKGAVFSATVIAAAVATLEKWSRGESGWSGTAEHRSGSLNQCCGMPSRTLLGRVCILYSWMEGPVWLVFLWN